MDVKILGILVLLWNVVAGQESSEDFSELLFRKYSANVSHLTVSELENLWVQLLVKNETTSIDLKNESSKVNFYTSNSKELITRQNY